MKDFIKKYKLIIGIVLLAIILLIPIPIHSKTNGDVSYNAIMYQIKKVHKVNLNEKNGFKKGTIVRILGIKIYDNTKQDLSVKTADAVTMEIKKDTLSNTGVVVVITDKTGEPNTYGEEYRIDKKVGNEYKEADIILDGAYGFNLIAYSLNPDRKIEMYINWEWLYGKLPNGEYALYIKLNGVIYKTNRVYKF